MFAQWAGSYTMYAGVILIGIAASAHQAYSANLYTTVSDAFPKAAVGSVIGTGGHDGWSRRYIDH